MASSPPPPPRPTTPPPRMPRPASLPPSSECSRILRNGAWNMARPVALTCGGAGAGRRPCVLAASRIDLRRSGCRGGGHVCSRPVSLTCGGAGAGGKGEVCARVRGTATSSLKTISRIFLMLRFPVCLSTGQLTAAPPPRTGQLTAAPPPRTDS
eukprot:9942-Chlamydomonas_euryale.AAC.1